MHKLYAIYCDNNICSSYWSDYLINQNLNFTITCFLTYLFKLWCQFSESLTQIFKYMHTQVSDFLYKRRHNKSVYVIGPAKIDHVSTNYTELYFY